MNTTIFCTFDHQDLADLAMGHIRAVAGVKTIHYLHSHQHGTARESGDLHRAIGSVGAGGVGFAFTNADGGLGRPPEPHPISVKITCSDDAKSRVVNRLVNQHAYRIIVTPQ